MLTPVTAALGKWFQYSLQPRMHLPMFILPLKYTAKFIHQLNLASRLCCLIVRPHSGTGTKDSKDTSEVITLGLCYSAASHPSASRSTSICMHSCTYYSYSAVITFKHFLGRPLHDVANGSWTCRWPWVRLPVKPTGHFETELAEFKVS